MRAPSTATAAGRRSLWVPAAMLMLAQACLLPALAEESPSRFSDKPIPPAVEEIPARPKPLLELGDPFLDTGEIGSGFVIPTGAVWRPQLLAFGTVRSALQHFDPGPGMRDEWVNRADVFLNLQLSPTERILVGSRMLDKNGMFTGYRQNPESQQGYIEEINANITTLYFEGDFGQLFPRLDSEDKHRLDYGFTFGRQPLLIQDGLLINDNALDAVAIVRNNLFVPGTTQGRVTGLWAFNEVHRGNNRLDGSADLYGLLFEADTALSTINTELLYVDSRDFANGLFLGLSAIQRIAGIGTTFAFVHSDVRGENTTEVADGSVIFAQANYTPKGSRNFVYASGFWGIDQFRSAARAPGTGTALGRAGILFAGVGIGGFGAALSNDPADAIGGVLGYQLFFSNFRRQLTLEIGGREELEGSETGAWAFGAQYQQAIGQRFQVRASAFAGERASTGAMSGISVELLYQL